MDRILKMVGDAMLGFRSIVNLTLAGLGTREQYNDVKSFFEGKDTESYNTYLAQGLDTILAKAVWVERDRDDVGQWLKENGFTKAVSEKKAAV